MVLANAIQRIDYFICSFMFTGSTTVIHESNPDAFSETMRSAWLANATCRLVLRGGDTSLVRPLRSSDAGLVADFFASLSDREIYYFFALDDRAARWLAERALDDAVMRLIALAEGDGGEHIIGYMFLDWSTELPPAFGACLKEEAQSQGLGGAMMEHFLTQAAAAGVCNVRLTAHAENWRALRLYQRLGFRVTDECILHSQGARQYRMSVDLRQARPNMLNNLTLIVRGGIGVGLAAAHIQTILEPLLLGRPPILDRPMHADDYAIVVSDLAAAPEHPFVMPEPSFIREQAGSGWVASLDARTVLVGGFGAAAVRRAADHYIHTVEALVSASAPPALAVEALPFSGLHVQC